MQTILMQLPGSLLPLSFLSIHPLTAATQIAAFLYI